jgi:peptidyl-prolyl cis-trans isomerase D
LADKEIQYADGVGWVPTRLPGAGRELGVIGAIFGMENGQLSGPIRGENAVFIVYAEDVSIADPSQMSSTQRNQIRNQLEQQKFLHSRSISGQAERWSQNP